MATIPVRYWVGVLEGLYQDLGKYRTASFCRRVKLLSLDDADDRSSSRIDMITKNADPVTKAQMEEFLYSIKDMVKYEEAYWLKHAERIKEVIGDVPLILVGGMKYPQTMAKILEEGKADLISLCRALIREPNFPKEMAEGRKDPAKCAFCIRCLMEVANKPLRCYNLG